jgi:methionyl-tRNA formyltransferase
MNPRFPRRARAILKILFFGLPLGALTLHAEGHTLTRAIICRPEALGLRRLRRTFENASAHVLVKPALTPALLDSLRADAPDLVVSWFWTERLPAEVLTMARLGAFGVHPSLLPRHRGPDPTYWTILHGDKRSGVTAHMLEADYDTGGILAQTSLDVGPNWNAWTLAKKLDRPSLRLLAQVAREREHLTPLPQDPAKVTEAPTPSDDDLELDLSMPAAQVLRHVRAAAPYPGAFFFFEDAPFAILDASLLSQESTPKALVRGECALLDGRLLLQCDDGALHLKRIRDENTLLEHEGTEMNALFTR